MAEPPPADLIEDLIAECLARMDAEGEQVVGVICERHPDLEPRVRAGLERLRGLGMGIDEAAVADTFPERLGAFRLIRRIGTGGMGVVYLAEQQPLGRQVALKVIRPEYLYFPGARDRFDREIAAVAQLKHPGIIPIYTVGEDHGVPHFAMEWVDGITLDRLLYELGSKAPERLSADRLTLMPDRDAASPSARDTWVDACCRVVHDVAHALHHAHERGVIHRDVKPSNILLARDGRVLLFDFGLALTDGGTRLTRTGSQMGSLPYMSPEQLRASSDRIDRRTDVYSLGVVLFELLTLRAPYLCEATELTRKQILDGAPPPMRQLNRAVPADAEAVCLRAMDLNPERRYQTAEHFARDLKNLLERRPVTARRPGPWLRARRFAERRPTLSLGLVMGAMLFVTAIAFALRERASANAIRQLADRHLLDHLDAEARSFWPGGPDLIPRIDRWLEQAVEIEARLGAHRAALTELRTRALPYDEAARKRDRAEPEARLQALRREREGTMRLLTDPTIATTQSELGFIDAAIAGEEQRLVQRQTWDFPSGVERWQHDQLEQLVHDLEAFPNRIEEVRQQRVVTMALRSTLTGEHAESWRRAIADIAATPAYRGLELEPQFGLVPIGKDPRSGLWEFSHVLSGAIPESGAGTRALDVKPRAEDGIVLVLLPGGTFAMGSDPTQFPGAESSEQPRHLVELNPFLLAKYELTIEQWRRLGGPPRLEVIVHRPMEPQQLTWLEANTILMRVGLDLPTEAQWEYACRAGSEAIYPTGDAPESLSGFANVADQGLERAKYPTSYSRQPAKYFPFDDGELFPAPVASFLPNAFGLHDMIGNVAEWCRDKLVLRAYRTMSPRPGDGLRDMVRMNVKHVVRGGHWACDVNVARCAARSGALDQDMVNMGVRPSRALEP